MTQYTPLSQRAASMRPVPSHDDTSNTATAPNASSVPDSQATVRLFSPEWVAGTAKAKELVAFLREEILTYEELCKIRNRARRPRDQETFDFMVERLVCDLCRIHFAVPKGSLRISRSNAMIKPRSKYSDPTHTRTRNSLLDMMASEALQLVKLSVGGRYWSEDQGLISTVAPGDHLTKAINRFGVTIEDLRYAPVGQTIWLKRRKDEEDFWDKPGFIEYEDTEEVVAYRDEVERINTHLARANLTLVGPAGDGLGVDLSNRFLRRGFTCGSFSSGGRLHGGFWQSMPKADRFSWLRIDGERLAEVDFRQILPRILYAKCGITPLMDDLYSIPCFSNHRDGVKALFCAMLFGSKPLRRFPRGVKELFPEGTKVNDVISIILKVHGPIRHMFFCGAGHRGQFTESQILVSVLLELNRQGVTALPIHDAVLIPASCTEIAKKVMLDQFWRKTGAEAKVKVEAEATV